MSCYPHSKRLHLRLFTISISFILLTTLWLSVVDTSTAAVETVGGAEERLDWIRVEDSAGQLVSSEGYVVSISESPAKLEIRSKGLLEGIYSIYVNSERLTELIPEPALIERDFELSDRQGKEWFLAQVDLSEDILEVSFVSFVPSVGQRLYTFGAVDSIFLERPMFVSLASVPHYENETYLVENSNGTFSYEVERYVDRLGVEFTDVNTSGQTVKIRAEWLADWGILTPSFSHSDGSPVINRSDGPYWTLEPDHFSIIWIFNTNEGFSKENEYPYSTADWDTLNRRIKIYSDRRDPNWASEMYRAKANTFVWDRTTRFTIRASWQTTQQGNWQQAFPLFFTAAGNPNLNSPNTIRVFYISRDSYLNYQPLYQLEYINSAGSYTLMATYYGQANTRYFFSFEYVPTLGAGGMLTLSMYDQDGNVLASGYTAIGASSQIFLGKVGAASKGEALGWEPIIIGHTDDIAVDVTSVRNGGMEIDDNGDSVPDHWSKLSSQNQYYTFGSSAEGFAKETNYPYSNLYWDSGNGRISVLSDRRDSGDEVFSRSIQHLDTDTDFTVMSRWRTTTQGNWQAAFPIFLESKSSSTANGASSIYVYYYSRDSNLGYSPYYYLQYKDSSGTLRINVLYVAAANTEYRFYVNYEASTQTLRMEIRNQYDSTLASGSYIVGSNPDDGFGLGKVGVSSDGWSGSYEPRIQGWVDDIVLSFPSASGSVYRSSVREFDGFYSVRIYDSSSTQAAGLVSVQTSSAEGGAGAYFKGSAWAYVTSGTQRLYLLFWDNAGRPVGSAYSSTSNTNLWEYVEVVAMAPDNSASTGIMLYSGKSNTGGAYWDKVELEVMREFWAMTFHDGEAGGGLAGWRLAFDRALDLGVSHIRTDLRWNQFEPGCDDCWDAQKIDYWADIIRMGRVRGIDLVAILNGPEPGWLAFSEVEYVFVNFAEFCQKIAYEYGDDLYYYQILNEMNHNPQIRGAFAPHILNCFDNIAIGEGTTGGNHKSAFKTIVNAFADGFVSPDSALRDWLDSAGSAIDIPAIDHYPGTWTSDGCPPEDPDVWAPLDTLFDIMKDYLKEGAIMETGYSSWDVNWANQGDQAVWVNCNLPFLRDRIRTHAFDNPNLPLVLGGFYELVDALETGPCGLVPQECHFGLLDSNLAEKDAYGNFMAHVSVYKF